MREESTLRLLYWHRPSQKYSTGAPTNVGSEAFKVIGYAEVRKQYHLESCEDWEEFKEYIESHQAVFYSIWFEDRLDTVPAKNCIKCNWQGDVDTEKEGEDREDYATYCPACGRQTLQGEGEPT